MAKKNALGRGLGALIADASPERLQNAASLINEGNLGLIKAAQRFDETRGFKFISYGVWWIRQSIMQAIAEQSRIVRLPLNRIGTLNKINKAYSKLEQEYERPPDSSEIADHLEVGDDEVRNTMKNSGRHVSMDAPLRTDEDNSLYDVLYNDDTTWQYRTICKFI